ncbi:MAG TPA: hypothetical protein PKZ76_11610 [Xanthomonadaceae bacterium]|nr:hypothetical protein [Xanthomonadaceae bacterium]
MLVLLLALGAGALFSEEGQVVGWTDPSVTPAETMPLAQRSLLLAVTQSAQRAIAVGERGHVLLSESRSDWRQAQHVPTRSTLTAVAAVGNRIWAVGHDQVILHSADGGETWGIQHVSPWTPENADDPGASAPLLSVLFLDEDNGFAVGAYGLLMRTFDGGLSWQREDLVQASDDGGVPDEDGDDNGDDNGWTFSDDDLTLDEEDDPHLNAIVRTGDGSLFIAAERGAAFRSTDGGETWERISLPYDGSMFGAIGYDGRHVVVFGLRGNAFDSKDLGDSWKRLETGVELSLMGGAPLADGGAVLVGANGVVLTRSAGEAGFRRSMHPDGVVLASALPIGGSRQIVVVGENGVGLYQIR